MKIEIEDRSMLCDKIIQLKDIADCHYCNSSVEKIKKGHENKPSLLWSNAEMWDLSHDIKGCDQFCDRSQEGGEAVFERKSEVDSGFCSDVLSHCHWRDFRFWVKEGRVWGSFREKLANIEIGGVHVEIGGCLSFLDGEIS